MGRLLHFAENQAWENAFTIIIIIIIIIVIITIIILTIITIITIIEWMVERVRL